MQVGPESNSREQEEEEKEEEKGKEEEVWQKIKRGQTNCEGQHPENAAGRYLPPPMKTPWTLWIVWMPS